ncbi:MAG: RDD family protein [Nitrososphaerales archaeon]
MAFHTKHGAPVRVAASTSGGPWQSTPTTGLSTLFKERAAQEYWVKRLVAYVIDAIIVYVIVGVVVAAAALPAYFAGLLVPGSSPHIAYFGGFFAGIAGLIFVLYFTVAEAEYGKTVGKHVMGLRVTTDSGQKPSTGTSLLRNISKIYWVLLLLDVVVGLALEVGYMKKFSDKFLGTKVS